MSTIEDFAVVAGLVLAGATRPALAGPQVPAPASGRETATSFRAPAVTSTNAPPSGERAPSAAWLAVLRARVGDREVRVSAGRGNYERSGARFDSAGVVFPPAGLNGMPLAAAGGACVGALLGSAFSTWPTAWRRAPARHGTR